MTTPPDFAARERALNLSTSFLVQAPAGSGKTELLTQRYLALLGAVDDPETIVAITFTRKAAGEMRTRIGDALRAAAGEEPVEEYKRKTWGLARAVLARDAERGWGLPENPSRLRVLTLDALCASIAAQMPWMSRLGGPPRIAEDAEELHREAALRTLALIETSMGEPVARLLVHVDNNHVRARDLLAAMLARRDQWLRHSGALDRAALEEALAAVREAGERRARAVVPDWAWAGESSFEAVAEKLLTKEGTVRKKFKDLQDCDLTALHEVRLLPPVAYTDAQWSLIVALFDVLKLAAAELRLLFQESRTVDFIEVAMGAIEALGGDDDPTALAYALDYGVQHLLIDEFQDTSVTKMRLLKRLTAEWTPGDGRTVFAVGDPMQSIYSFQEAEVTLFRRCRENGLGRLPLEFLQLTANFRSSSDMVAWFNGAFPAVLGGRDDDGEGAVRYTASEPTRAPGGGAEFHAVAGEMEESRRVAELVEAAEGMVAILVRTKAAAKGVAREMRSRGIKYQAVEIELLADRPIVQDLRALTRYLLHPGDRLARLSVARAPWFGKRLAELLADDSLDDEVLRSAIAERSRRPLRQWVEETWRALGGPACLRDEAEREDAETFFQLLEGAPEDIARLDRELSKLFAAADPKSDGRVQILTMHKAKGLEFDTVILAGLARPQKNMETSLLRWRETVGGEDLIVGSLRELGGDEDLIYKYLGRLRAAREKHEGNRLLYVAATRARRHLHITGWVKNGQPEASSFLARLWHVAASAFGGPALPAVAPVAPVGGAVRRLTPSWRQIPLPKAMEWTVDALPVDDEPVSYDWSGETLRLIGTAVHGVMERMAEERWTIGDVERYEGSLRARLVSLGVPAGEMNAALDRTMRALRGALASERGKWVLGDHHEARNEWELCVAVNRIVRHYQLDRTFVDADGVRWIIDYKTSSHEGGGLESFLDNERERHRPQLERYAEVMARMDARPIKLGLYFPLLDGWREWGWERSVAGKVGADIVSR
ncbi:MAG: DNA helicase UvrD [Acidobacteria bacterium]|nr:DNA helicase UvrD [Acidobacteriota bacterium]